jgi:hypothetical protein
MERNYIDNARSVIDLINLGIRKTDLLSTVLTSLIELAKDPRVENLYVSLDEERVPSVVAKTHFEILCFASYWTSTLISNYATTRSFLKKKVDIEGAQIFYKSIRSNLKESSEINGFNMVHDLELKTISPEITVGPTELLSSEKRLDQYEKIAIKGGSMETIKRYSKHLAITFALADYPMFEMLTLTFAEPTIRIVDITMKEVFVDS